MPKVIKLELKYATNVCTTINIHLPKSGVVVIAAPMECGMFLLCNSESTLDTICERLGDEVFNTIKDHPLLMAVPLDIGNDEGITALNTLLKNAGFRVDVQSEIPWLVGRWH